MKNMTTTVLASLLAVATIAGAFLVMQLSDRKKEHRADRERIVRLTGDLAAAEEGSGKLSARLEEAKARIELLEGDAGEQYRRQQQTITELTDRLKAGEVLISELEKEQDASRRNLILAKEEMTRQGDEKQAGLLEKTGELERAVGEKDLLLSEKMKMIGGLQEELAASRDRIAILEENIGKKAEEAAAAGAGVGAKPVAKEEGVDPGRAGKLATTHDQLVEKLGRELANRDATITSHEKRLTVTFLCRILFDFAQATIRPEGKEVLERIGGVLRENGYDRLWIVGHADNIPIASWYRFKFASNWELSAARAASIARFFQEENGLDPAKIDVIGRSFHHPVGDNRTEEGRARNRRVEITIVNDNE
jgi:chemotaxis protein MotB